MESLRSSVRRLHLATPLILCAVLSTNTVASQSTSRRKTSSHDQVSKRRALVFWRSLRAAQRALASSDLDGANRHLNEISEEDRKRLEYLHTRVLYSMARESYQAALEDLDRIGARSQSSPTALVRVYFLRAEVLERMPGKLGEARAAWTTLLKFLKKNPTAMDAKVAQRRIAAIDRASEQEYVYRSVRKRIANNARKER